MASGIYEIVNATNGKRYIGSAKSIDARFTVHRHELRNGTHHSSKMQRAWDKHGEHAFEFRKLIICSVSNLLLYEQIAFDALGPEYNICKVAGSALGVKWSEDARMRARQRNRDSNPFQGRKHTAETLAKMAAARRGKPSPTNGIKRDPAAVARTAAAHIGRKRSEETRARISAAMTGKKREPKSAETRAKLSEAMKARPANPERVARMAETKRGSKLSAEHKARIGAASRAAWAIRKQKGSSP